MTIVIEPVDQIIRARAALAEMKAYLQIVELDPAYCPDELSIEFMLHLHTSDKIKMAEQEVEHLMRLVQNNALDDTVLAMIEATKSKIQYEINELLVIKQKACEENRLKLQLLQSQLCEAREAALELNQENMQLQALLAKYQNPTMEFQKAAIAQQETVVMQAKELAKSKIKVASIFAEEKVLDSYCGKTFYELKTVYSKTVYPHYHAALHEANALLQREKAVS